MNFVPNIHKKRKPPVGSNSSKHSNKDDTRISESNQSLVEDTKNIPSLLFLKRKVPKRDRDDIDPLETTPSLAQQNIPAKLDDRAENSAHFEENNVQVDKIIQVEYRKKRRVDLVQAFSQLSTSTTTPDQINHSGDAAPQEINGNYKRSRGIYELVETIPIDPTKEEHAKALTLKKRKTEFNGNKYQVEAKPIPAIASGTENDNDWVIDVYHLNKNDASLKEEKDYPFIVIDNEDLMYYKDSNDDDSVDYDDPDSNDENYYANDYPDEESDEGYSSDGNEYQSRSDDSEIDVYAYAAKDDYDGEGQSYKYRHFDHDDEDDDYDDGY